MIKYLHIKLSVFLVVLAVTLATAPSAWGQATVVIQIDSAEPAGTGFTDPTPVAPVGGNGGTTLGQQRLNAFQFAANIWGATLNSGPTITVRARWEALSCTATSGTLASAGAAGLRQNFLNAPFSGTWYPSALANALSGNDTSDNPEITARFNVNLGTPGCLQNRPWYLGLDGNHGSGTDLVVVVLHEFGHGLGFQNFTNAETGNFAGTAPGFPSVWDRFLLDNSTGKLWFEMTAFERVASAINTGNLVWAGPQVTASVPGVLTAGADSSNRVRMFAPNPLEPGSSVSHYDRTAFPNLLMEPNISAGLSHTLGPPRDLTLPLLVDIGWNSASPSPTPTPSPPPNDNFASAQVISGCSGSVNGTNAGATKESGEPDHASNGGTRSVWYLWQAPATGSVTITTAGSGYDTVLGVYTGSAVNSLSLIAENNDAQFGVITTSTVTFNATVGVAYRIAVGGFNNGSGGEVGPITLNWTASNCSTGPQTIQFTQSSLSVGEAAGSVSVTVTRTGNTSSAASVNYATTDNFGAQCNQTNTGIASARCDFNTAGGTLQFAAGETTKPITVSIIDDGYDEGNETFTLTLSNPSGMTLGAPASTTITIVDNSDVPAHNPFNNNAFFVRQQYLDFLFREPDTAGFNDWLNVLTNCAPNQGGLGSNPACDRVHVSSGFFRSTEFGERGYWAYRFYHGPLGRRPNFTEFIPDMRRLSRTQTLVQQEAARAAFVADFMQRPEFTAIYAGLTNAANAAQFIAKLEEKSGVVLPATVPPTQPGQPPQFGRAELIAKMQSGEFTAAQTLRAFIEQKVVFDQFFFRAFVAMQYFGYLLRDPEDTGYNDWVDVLTNGRGPIPPGDFRHLIFGFVWSVEYRQRFGP